MRHPAGIRSGPPQNPSHPAHVRVRCACDEFYAAPEQSSSFRGGNRCKIFVDTRAG